MSSLVLKAAGKAKGRLRERRSRHPPSRPPPPRVSLKSLELESESSFENVLDRPDEVSNPLFAYTASPEHASVRPAEPPPPRAGYPEDTASDLFASDEEHVSAPETRGRLHAPLDGGSLSPHGHLGDPLTGQLVSGSSSGASRSSGSPPAGGDPLGSPYDPLPLGAHSPLQTSTAPTSEDDYSDYGAETLDLGHAALEEEGQNGGPGVGLALGADLAVSGESDDELFKSALSMLQAHHSSFDVDHSSEEEGGSTLSSESGVQHMRLSSPHIPPDLPEDGELLYPYSPDDGGLFHVHQSSSSASSMAPSPDIGSSECAQKPGQERGDLDSDLADPNMTPVNNNSNSDSFLLPTSPPQPIDVESASLHNVHTEMRPRSSPVVIAHDSSLAAHMRSPSDPVQLSDASQHPLSAATAVPNQLSKPPGQLRVGSAPVETDNAFVILEDHFGTSSTAQATEYPAIGPASRRNLKKTNSVGKVAPPRPSMSPKLRESIKRRSTDAGLPPPPKPKVTTEYATCNGEASEVISAESRVPIPARLTEARGASVRQGQLTEAGTDLFPPATSPPPRSTAIDSLKESAGTLTSASHRPGRLAGVRPRDASKKDLLFEERRPLPSAAAEQDDLIPPLPPQQHMLLAFLLYLFLSLNVSPYFAGLVSGFFLFFLTLGALFIYYAHNGSEEPAAAERSTAAQPLSEEFVRRMNVNFQQIKCYQSRKFTAVSHYDPATHHPNSRFPVQVSLKNNFSLTMEFPNQTHSGDIVTMTEDIRNTIVRLVPLEVFENRKRRWSKKFPIEILNRTGSTFAFFLFAPTSRLKEDWYRRLRAASEGHTADKLIANVKDFFRYMQKYFPATSIPLKAPLPPLHTSTSPTPSFGQHRRSGGRSPANAQPSSSVIQFSNRPEEADIESSVVITKQPRPLPAPRRPTSSPEPGSAVDPRTRSPRDSSCVASGTTSLRPAKPHPSGSGHLSAARPGFVDDFEVIPNSIPPPLRPKETDWINALAARLCWDVWHEERWRDWVHGRIQRKLIRVKTPSFMDQLRLKEVHVGRDMPVINRLHAGPELRLDGIWVYLDVTFRGSFVMTIETKLKLGATGEEGVTMKAVGEPMSLHTSRPKHSLAASPLEGLGEAEIDSGSDDEDHSGLLQFEKEGLPTVSTQPSHPLPSHPHPSAAHAPVRTKLVSMMTRLTKKVASTKIVRRAAEKVSSYPMVLTVEVKRLDGVLAVNIPPPPADTIWYSFLTSPHLELSAKPKLGQREVTLARVTTWIEKKLAELVNKKLVLPNMEDLVIPILNSGLPEDKDKIVRLTSPSS